MINVHYDKLYKFLPSAISENILSFLKSCNSDMAEKQYYIQDGVFVRIMSYKTKQKSECNIEAHNKYVDIQFTLKGSEGISLYERSRLKEISPYNADDDIVFFNPQNIDYLMVKNIPGYFSIIFPEEAHQPMIYTGDDIVKKGVIKINTEYFSEK